MMDTYLREHFASWVSGLPTADSEAWVRSALEKCKRHGVTTEPEAAQLILLFLLLGLEADETLAWVQDALSDRALLPIGKLRKLIRLAREHGVNHLDEFVVYDNMES